jgi:hypothetical protein
MMSGVAALINETLPCWSQRCSLAAQAEARADTTGALRSRSDRAVNVDIPKQPCHERGSRALTERDPAAARAPCAVFYYNILADKCLTSGSESDQIGAE